MDYKSSINSLEKDIINASLYAYKSKKESNCYRKSDKKDISNTARKCESELDQCYSILKKTDIDINNIQNNYNNEIKKIINEINKTREKLIKIKDYELCRYDIKKIEDNIDRASKNAYNGSNYANKSYTQAESQSEYNNDLNYAWEYLDNTYYYSKKAEDDLDDAKKQLRNLELTLEKNYLKLTKEKLIKEKKKPIKYNHVIGIKRR